MPRSIKIGSVFQAHSRGNQCDYERLMTHGPPPSRRVVVSHYNPDVGLARMTLVKTALENRPTPLRLLWVPVYFLESNSFHLEEYLRGLCRILQLSTPDSLNLECVMTEDGFTPIEIERVSAALLTIQRVLCPAILAIESLVHIGVHVVYAAPELPIEFIDFIDDIFSSIPSCYSLGVSLNTTQESVAKRLVRVLRQRTSAHLNNPRFHKITRIKCSVRSVFSEYFDELAQELSGSLRVSDFSVKCKGDFFGSPEELPEYQSLFLEDPEITSRLAEALSNPGSSIRGLILNGWSGLRASIAQVLGNAIGSSQLEEINVVASVCPEVLDAIAEGVSRSQIRHVSVSCGNDSNVEYALVKMLSCASLRELEIRVSHLRKPYELIALVLGHPSLEYCLIGDLVPQDEAYDRMYDGNFAQSVRLLTLLLLQWVGSFTELAAVDINLFRFIRMLMVMPTE